MPWATIEVIGQKLSLKILSILSNINVLDIKAQPKWAWQPTLDVLIQGEITSQLRKVYHAQQGATQFDLHAINIP